MENGNKQQSSENGQVSETNQLIEQKSEIKQKSDREVVSKQDETDQNVENADKSKRTEIQQISETNQLSEKRSPKKRKRKRQVVSKQDEIDHAIWSEDRWIDNNDVNQKMNSVHQQLLTDEIEKFEQHKKEKFIYICTCCHRLHFKRSLKLLDMSKFDETNEIVARCLSSNLKRYSPDQNVYICHTCKNDLSKTKPIMPAMAAANNLEFEPIPAELQDLNELERRFISLRIPFMKIVGLPRGGQRGIHGQCVNVPSSLKAITTLLPRLPEEVQLVHIKLKRKLEYKGHHMSMKIRPNRILGALQWLIDNNPLYETVEVDPDWEEKCEESPLWEHLVPQKKSVEKAVDDDLTTDDVEYVQKGKENKTEHKKETYQGGNIKKYNNKNIQKKGSYSQVEDTEISEYSDSDNVERMKENQGQISSESDDEEFQQDQAAVDRNAEITAQPSATCIQLEDIEGAMFSVAPGEGNTPKHILMDDDFEVLSFPDLFPSGRNGFNTQRERKIDLRRYAHQRVRNCDDRCSLNPEYYFAQQYASEVKQVCGNQGMALRIKRGKTTQGQKINAGMLKNSSKVAELIHQDNIMKFLQNVRGSPSYWRKELYEAFAMLKTFGIPSLFMTFSCADMQWPEIVQAIYATEGKPLSESEFAKLGWNDKASAVARNPMISIYQFIERFKAIHNFLTGKSYPLGKISNFIEKMEFQVRGSPHYHCIYWVDAAPLIGIHSESDVCKFIDEHICAQIPDKSANELYDLVSRLQIHYCSDTCRKGKKRRGNADLVFQNYLFHTHSLQTLMKCRIK